MHAGNHRSPTTAAGRVYAVLAAQSGVWMGGWDLTLAAQTSAVATRVWEVDQGLDGEGNRERIERRREGRKWFYRHVRVAGQLELAI